MISFVIPGEPVAKGRPKLTTRGGFAHAYTPAKTRAAEQTVIARALPFAPPQPLAGAIVLSAVFVFGFPVSMSKKRRIVAAHTGRPDVDNCMKLLVDALQGVFFLDDKQIVSAHIHKRYSERPRIEVQIEEWRADDKFNDEVAF